jgi:hypothetical protein
MPSIDPEVLRSASREDLLELALQLQQLQRRAAQVGPQTDDELHALILDKYGMNVPRTAPEPGHDAPFTFVADIFFGRVTAAIVVGGRESGKTSMVALIHALKARYYPGYEGISAGAVEQQSKRAYANLKKFNLTWGRDLIESSLESETRWKNGSAVEILPGTQAALNGPHSNLLHRDEVELFKKLAFDEGDNITKSGWTTDGRPIPAQDVLTTSLKKAKGLAQNILNECKAAIDKGLKPPYKVYVWGVSETVQNQPTCRMAKENEGKPEHELCDCHLYVKGKWDDKSDRALDVVCNGRFFRSEGWRPIEDIKDKFLKNSRRMWEMQQESKQAASELLMLPNFSETEHGIIDWRPTPENGKTYIGVDFGGTNAHAAVFYQKTNKKLWGYRQEFEGDKEGIKIEIPAGSLVAYDEVYVTEVGNVVFGNMVLAKMGYWEQQYPGAWEVTEIYADIAAKSARLDWANSLARPLRSVWRIERDIEEHVLLCNEIIEDYKFFVNVKTCPMFVAEAKVWERDETTGKQVDEFNHVMSGFRYAVANIHRLEQIQNRKKNAGRQGAAAAEKARSKDTDNPLSKMPGTGPATGSYAKDDPFNDMKHDDPSGPSQTGRMW